MYKSMYNLEFLCHYLEIHLNSISNDLTNPVNSQSGNNIEILSADVPQITRVRGSFYKDKFG